jgi:hypothetical protein
MKQNNKLKLTKLKLAILLTITTINISCATKNPHRKIALRIIKNNNMILKEIKKERIKIKITPNINNSPKLLNAEVRLITAINAVIRSNESLKKEFQKNNKKGGSK